MASRYLTTFSAPRRLPAASLTDLQQEFNRLIESAFGDFGGNFATPAGGASVVQAPRLDVDETDQEFCISAELPGVQAADLDVRLDNDILTISGEKKTERNRDQSSYHMMERSYGRFTRSVQLPFAPRADQVQAQFQDGVLTLHIPKQAQQEQSRRIEVKTGSAGAAQPSIGGGESQQPHPSPDSGPGGALHGQGAQGGQSGQAGSGMPPTTH